MRVVHSAQTEICSCTDLCDSQSHCYSVIRMLQNMLEVQDSMVFWRHLRLMQSPLDILDKDGVIIGD